MSDLLYILSPSYSGSTLLTFLLGSNPAIATVGELKATSRGDVESYLCSCGTRIVECGFWRRVSDAMVGRGMPFDVRVFGTHFQFPSPGLGDRLVRAGFRGGLLESIRDTALRCVPPWRRRFRQIMAVNRALIEVILELRGARVFVDGSKDPVRLKYLWQAGHWNVSVIHLLRDGRASTSSYMRIRKATAERAAREWRASQEECDRLAARLPASSVIPVHYERLCTQPDATMACILGRLGLNGPVATSDFRAVQQHLLGHAMRLRSGREVVLDEKWKQKLTPADLAAFDRVAGELNRQHGYE